RHGQALAQLGLVAGPPFGQRDLDEALAEYVLIAVGTCGKHGLDAHRAVPVVGGGRGAAIRAKADQHGGVAERRFAGAADIDFALPAHCSRRGIADMRVVRPDYLPAVLCDAWARDAGNVHSDLLEVGWCLPIRRTELACGPLSPSCSTKRTSLPTTSWSKASLSTALRLKKISYPSSVSMKPQSSPARNLATRPWSGVSCVLTAPRISLAASSIWRRAV